MAQKLDDIVLHPVWGIIMLLFILFMVFQAVYTWAAPIMEAIEGGFAALGEWIGTNMEPGILSDLLVNGVIAGLGSVLVFVPQITFCSPSSCFWKTQATCRVRRSCWIT